MPDVSLTITYKSVVSCDTVGIYLTMAELNNMSIKTADIMSAYSKALCGENLYNILGPEFVPDEGKMVIIVRAFYEFKIAGAYFRNHLDECIQFMGYKPFLADPDL